jgi:hypothetical protein
MKKMSKEELVVLVTKICNAEFETEEEWDSLLDLLENNVPDPAVSNLLYYHKPKLTPEEIVDKALNYKPICL